MNHFKFDYNNFNGNKSTFSCPVTIDNFVKYMNDTVYGLDFVSPYGMANPSWCKLNVTNCNPPGYMSACPSNPDQLGYLSIFKSSNNTIKVCSNLEFTSGSIVYIENFITFDALNSFYDERFAKNETKQINDLMGSSLPRGKAQLAPCYSKP